MYRIITLLAFGFVVYVIFQWLKRASSSDVKCSRCDGRGFWYGARGREKCDWCRGSGRLPKGLD